MDVMDEMSMNNNINEMLGVNTQKTSFPINMNFISESDSITDIFLKNSQMPNSNVNINVYKNVNTKNELQTYNGLPLTTINEDYINYGETICSSPDITKVAFLNSNTVLPENITLDVPRVSFQSLEYYPSINDYTEEYYPSVNNHYNNIYSVPKYRKLSNSYNNVDINVNVLLENDNMAVKPNTVLSPELLMNADSNNYLPSLVNSPDSSQSESSQVTNSPENSTINSNVSTPEPFHFNSPYTSPYNSNINTLNNIPNFQFNPNFNNNTTNVYYTTSPVQYTIPQLVSSPLNSTKLLTIEEEPKIKQEIVTPTVIPLNDTIQPMAVPVQMVTPNYINANLTTTSPIFNGMAPPKMVNMESVCPMKTYCQPQNRIDQTMVMTTASYPSNIQTTTTPINYMPYTVQCQNLGISNENFLDQESLKNRKIINPTRKLNKNNTTSNLYNKYIEENKNKLEANVKKESTSTINSSLPVEQKNAIIQNASQESVSSAETSELKLTKKRSLDSTETEGNIKCYSVCTSNKNDSLTNIENETINVKEKMEETKDTKNETEKDNTTTSFGATVSTEALIDGLVVDPASTTKTKTKTTTKTTKKRKSTKKEKPPKPDFYPCTYVGCGKVFTKPYNLKSHIKIHSSERPFKCQYCKARFSRGHDLNRHTRLHTGVKPFECQKCKKRFSRSDALSHHIKVEACVVSNQNKNNKKSQSQTKNA